jgi:hypothetical protein
MKIVNLLQSFSLSFPPRIVKGVPAPVADVVQNYDDEHVGANSFIQQLVRNPKECCPA